MTDVAVDTLVIARSLEAAGIERRQAEAHAEALRQVADANRGELATRTDLKAEIAAVRAEIAAVRAEIAALEALLTNRLYGVVLTAVISNGLFAAAVIVAIKLLP